MTRIVKVFLLSCVFFIYAQIHAQSKEGHLPKLFLNCEGECFPTYLKSELIAFPFVRDRFQADIELFILARRSPNGGALYNVNMIGWNAYEAIQDTFDLNTYSFDSDDERRNKILKAVQLMLIRNLDMQTMYQYSSMKFTAPDSNQVKPDFDPWNYFIFNVGSSLNINGESNRTTISVWNWASLNRITNESKLNAWMQYNYSSNRFVISGEPIEAVTQRFDARFYYAKTLTQHWSLGGVAQVYQDVFSNLAISYRGAPVLEYNIYPFKEAMHRQFRFAYQAGAIYNQYQKETIFNKIEELRPYHKLSVILDITQPWGTIRSLAYASSYLDRPGQNRFTVSNSVRLRLVKGLSAALIGNASAINDQISLAKASVNPDLALLRAQQLPTTYTFDSYVELNYTFGSINNSIINPRMNQID